MEFEIDWCGAGTSRFQALVKTLEKHRDNRIMREICSKFTGSHQEKINVNCLESIQERI